MNAPTNSGMGNGCQRGLSSPKAGKPGMDALDQIALIRQFQRIEGNFDCCASAYVKVCQQFDCLWRNKCLAFLQTTTPS
ncbi:MAG TPA: hypothetical protein VK149_00405 [Sideroxyarcus sp.]|nr:hypothetical protein [Sideroxyarcus sp.]